MSIDTHGTGMQLGLVAGGLGIGIGLAPTDVSRASPWHSQPSVVEVSDFALAVWLVFPRYPASPRRSVGLLA